MHHLSFRHFHIMHYLHICVLQIKKIPAALVTLGSLSSNYAAAGTGWSSPPKVRSTSWLPTTCGRATVNLRKSRTPPRQPYCPPHYHHLHLLGQCQPHFLVLLSPVGELQLALQKPYLLHKFTFDLLSNISLR